MGKRIVVNVHGLIMKRYNSSEICGITMIHHELATLTEVKMSFFKQKI